MTKLQAVGELLVGFIKSIIHIVWLHRIPKVIQRLQERGTFTVNRADCGAPRRRHTPNFEEDVLHRVEEIPSTNTRTIVCGMGVPHSTVWEVLHEQQLHSYHPQRVHAMGPGNFALRTNFFVWFLHCCVEETQFPWQILFTDECRFTRVTVLNLQTDMFGMTKIPMPRMPMDPSNVSALMCGQVLWMVVWLGLTFFHPALQVMLIFLRIIGSCVIGLLSMPLVSTWWCTTPFCRCGLSSP